MDSLAFGVLASILLASLLRRTYVEWRVERWCMRPFDAAMKTSGVLYDDSIAEWKRRYDVFNATHAAPLWHWTPDAAREAIDSARRGAGKDSR